MNVRVIYGTRIINIEYTEAARLDKILADAGIVLQQPCSGRGTCGKCAVKAGGYLSPVTSAEEKLLGEKALADGFRLACRTFAEGDAVIEYAPKNVSAITEGTVFSSSGLIKRNKGFGAVFDIGTTTVAASLTDLETGKRVYSHVELNAQSRFGADVISRMEYANSGGLEEEHRAIIEQLENITKLFPHVPDTKVVTGNTTMLHLYEGLKLDSLAVYPFTPSSLFGEKKGNTYIAPCIGAFVGADITAAILASGMTERSESSILVDLGTNGEMAFNSGGRLICCSTAMGPAFEGAGISSGMTASDGAIDRVFIASSRLEYSVIGGTKAAGITGSGLIDAIACMLELGETDETGYLEAPFFIGDSGISITPADVRAVQLAKSAIRSALDTLCKNFTEISAFYIAGGFGKNLNLNSCVRIGLFPSVLASKAVILGNASLTGGEMLLTRENAVKKAEEIAQLAQDINLASIPEFSEKFIDNMYF